MTKKKHVIIGTSAAGIGAVNKLRELDPAAEIVWISDEKEMPYNKCLLAGFLEDTRALEKVFTRDAAYMQAHNITLFLGKRVIDVLPCDKTVVLDGGQKISYDNLLIATGTAAHLSKTPGADLKGVLKYQTLADALKIHEYVRTETVKNIVIVGAGLSGLECADALHMSDNKRVTLIESQNTVLPMVLDLQGSEFLVDQMQKKEMQVFLGKKVEEIIGINDRVTQVLLSDKTTIPADIVIFAVGCKPNSDCVQGAGIELQSNFIVVDELQQTSIPSIFAAGDVSLVRNQLTGERAITNRWSDAVMQGIVAGSTMAGHSRVYEGIIPRSSSSFFGVRLLAGGHTVHDAGVELRTKKNEYCVEVFVVKNDVVVGFYVLSLGTVDAAMYKRLLQNK